MTSLSHSQYCHTLSIVILGASSHSQHEFLLFNQCLCYYLTLHCVDFLSSIGLSHRWVTIRFASTKGVIRSPKTNHQHTCHLDYHQSDLSIHIGLASGVHNEGSSAFVLDSYSSIKSGLKFDEVSFSLPRFTRLFGLEKRIVFDLTGRRKGCQVLEHTSHSFNKYQNCPFLRFRMTLQPINRKECFPFPAFQPLRTFGD